MSGKKGSGWKPALLGLLLSGAVELAGAVVTALLILQGTLEEGRAFPLLVVFALAAGLAGGVAAGKGSLGPAGSLANGGGCCLILLAVCFGVWGRMASRGVMLLAAILLGSAIVWGTGRKVGKGRRKGLV